MKFEMKKRILALALAGTTAFSVFGAAMSANAATLPDDLWNAIKDYFDSSWSSHEGANDGAEYKSYNETGPLNWSTQTNGYHTETINNSYYYLGTQEQYEADKKDGTIDASKAYMAPWRTNGAYDGPNSVLWKAMQDVKTEDIDNFRYFANYKALADAYGYDYVIVDNGNGVVEDNNGNSKYVIAQNTNTKEYYIFDYEVWKANHDNNQTDFDNHADSDIEGKVFFVKDIENLNTDIKVANGKAVSTIGQVEEKVADDYAHYMINASEADPENGNNILKDDGLTLVSGAVNDTIVTSQGTPSNSLWESNGGDTVTKIVGGLDTLEEVMAEEVKPDDVAYAYDFLLPIREDTFMDAWEDGTLIDALAYVEDDTKGTIYPETSEYTSYYNVSDIREEVLYAWEDFLDNIGISDLTDRGLTKWATATIENYVYQYTDDVTVRVSTVNNLYDIYVVTTEKVDLYNFEQLIADIMNRAPTINAMDAQTSELVYLMQQYYKYTEGGYVDVKPVETDDWGDLLVALAQAPTEDEFSTAAAYRRYTNKVEDLVEQYMEAETSAAVDMAEDELYDFVTDYFSTYRYAAKADTTVLENAIDKLFFNYDWEEDYTVDTKEYGAEAYPGAMDKDGELNKQNSVDPYDYGRATYAMYPGKDYGDSTNKVKNYPGVNDYIDYSGLNSSYFWFANVYTLAYNVYQNNEYQSVIDLMAETLNEAVDNLSVNSLMNAQPSDILGAEEANEKLDARIETDYTAAMWNDLSKVNSFITDRVSAKEIGETGTNNAEKIAELVESAAKLQRNQSVVTRSEIDGTAGVKTALKNAQTTLAALEKDDDNYNAAQATALKNAINDCQEIIDLYNGNYSTSMYSQSVNGKYDGKVGDKDQILKSDITGAIQAVEDAINFKNVIQGWTETENGWKYGVEDTYDSALTWGVEDTLEGPHYLNFGWAKIGNTWFYFDEEGIALKSDWLQVGNDWYYFNSNCGASIGWAKVDGKWYYFNGGCRMMTGWVKVDGNYYYLSSSGAMVTGWCQVGGKWYYLSQESNSLGQMLYSTTTPDGYQVGADGALVE